MAQTHYIEIDEEIISTVSRLRKSSEAENVFVFPKRALILQSIVNLKLLEREASKLGKKIIIVTQDSEGRLLAEKAGFATQQYNEESMRGSEAATTRFTVRHGEDIPMPKHEPGSETRPHSNAIGSNDFYRSGAPQETSITPARGPVSTVPVAPRPLRIRNVSPSPQTSLNSLRSPEPPLPRSLPERLPLPIRTGDIVSGRPPLLRTERERLSEERSAFSDRQEKLHRFLSGSRSPVEEESFQRQEMRPTPPPIRETPSVNAVPPSKMAPWAFIVLGCFSAVALVGGAFFLFLPKADVFIVPQGSVQTMKYQFVGTKEAMTEGSEATAVPVRILESEKTISFSAESTGQETNGSAKARGTVVIYNDFSSASQPLVATTRLMMSDGKIFRLLEGVTVPGITEVNGNRQPGAIEATVIADQAGGDYNVGPSEFKIPGFQGSSKYDKFSAKSTKSMTGGGDGTGSGTKSLSRTDLDNAAKKAESDARAVFVEEAKANLRNGEKLLDESIEVTAVGSPSAPPVGTAGNNFNYEARYKVRSFILSEDAIRAFIDKQSISSTQGEGVALKPVTYELTYGKPLSNFTESKVEVSVQAKMTLRAPVEVDALRSELLGQGEEGIRSVLEKHPEIKRLRVEFKPKIFLATIPKNPDRVTIILSDDEE
ncbi:MAG: hypothetical protein ABI747_04390 [Candidatus Moraniibacteriota bacterium]